MYIYIYTFMCVYIYNLEVDRANDVTQLRGQKMHIQQAMPLCDTYKQTIHTQRDRQQYTQRDRQQTIHTQRDRQTRTHRETDRHTQTHTQT